MLNFQVIPGIGIGPVHLGFTRQQVEEALGTGTQSVLPRDSEGHEKQGFFYPDCSLNVEYSDKESIVEWIGVSKNTHFKVIYNDIDLFALEAEELVSLISKETPFDENDFELGYSYIFPELELALWRSSMPKDFEGDKEFEGEEWYNEDLKKSRYFQTVSLGIKGYYSNMPK